jgi:hypothetical protein
LRHRSGALPYQFYDQPNLVRPIAIETAAWLGSTTERSNVESTSKRGVEVDEILVGALPVAGDEAECVGEDDRTKLAEKKEDLGADQRAANVVPIMRQMHRALNSPLPDAGPI